MTNLTRPMTLFEALTVPSQQIMEQMYTGEAHRAGRRAGQRNRTVAKGR